ncbi:glycine--tRNA ligase [Candidatus Pacearchaeota archaeon]|nr:glycine--tRNA ligase [Candidatus Pacearchaeota archaeon]
MTENKVDRVKISLVKKEISVDEMAAFCKRKGFAYPSSEIYGGLAGFYDYGSLGFLLKKNFENVWRSFFLGLNDNFVEIESSEVMPEKVFVGSGHLKNFNDFAAKCKKGHIERADHLLEKNLNQRFEGLSAEELFGKIKENKIKCSICGSEIEFVEITNMMFPIQLGFGNNIKAFLRPETAQSPYVNFKIQSEVMRKKLPLGIALIGRAYRNELSPRNFLLRQRAFTQAELQIFFNPSKIDEHEEFDEIKDYFLRVVLSDEREKGIQKVKCQDLLKKIPKFYVYYLAKVQQFYFDILNFPEDKFRFYELNHDEKAFYNKYHFDMEAELDFLGWTEIGGVHYRTDHDLKGHQEVSKENLAFYDDETKDKFIPHVLELSFGVDRNFYSIMNFSYFFDSKMENIVLKIPPKLAPIKASVFPIVKVDENIVKYARDIFNGLKKHFNVIYDDGGSIGRRYSRADEGGIPFCITIDEQALKDKTVTIRDRDSTEQVRVKVVEIKNFIERVLSGENPLKLGKIIQTRKK